MAAYVDLYDLVRNEAWIKRITVALWKAGADVLAEDESMANHGVRVALSRKAITSGIQTPLSVFSVIILQNATLFANGAASTDADIQFAVNQYFTTLAQVEAKYGS